mmetsp:Transcript_53441/g.140556  ORF Transcript_53441/g.140556 Transcript_53441/m.140556 type:complete len:132 (-) Transcript_53441:360-755(-)
MQQKRIDSSTSTNIGIHAPSPDDQSSPATLTASAPTSATSPRVGRLGHGLGSGGGGNGGDDDSSNGGGTNGNEPAGAQAKDGTGSAGISVKSVQQLLDMHQQLAKSLASIGQVHEEMGNQLKRSLAATTAA